MTSQTPRAADAIERVLAYGVAVLVALSLIAFIVDIAATAAGASDQFGTGLWPVVLMLPELALPLGFVLVIALLVMNFVRRGREARAKRQ